MEEEGDTRPFWLQATDDRRRRRNSGGQSSSFFFNTGIFVILLVFLALAFIFFVIPSFLSFTSQILSPHSVKKGWNSLNLVLVLVAIVCGFLSGNGSNGENGGSEGRNSFARGQRSSSSSTTPRQWYEFSDRNSLRRMRSSNSYPDLRVGSPWTADDDRWRFYDDTRVYDYRGSSSNQLYHRRSRGEREEEWGFGSTTKDIDVDSVVTEVQRRVSHGAPPHRSPPRPQSPPAQPVPPPSPPRPESPPPAPQSPPLPAPKVVGRKPKRTYQDLASTRQIDGMENNNSQIRNPQQQTPSTPPPPPPPPPPLFEKSSKSEKKRGSATKDFLNSLRRKKKKQRQRSVENLDALFNPEPSSSTLPLYPPPSPPPPPPPPPPPAFFHNIFSGKKSKAKKTHSPAPAPSPPQPKPLEARASKVVSQKAPMTTSKPPLPVKISSITDVEEGTDSGNESPLIPIPPPPPFKMPELKFVVQGDFVRLKSFQSSRSGSPDSDGVEDPLSGESSPSDGRKGESGAGDSSAAMFCPSPDVNTKADDFIARFRAGLQLEKTDSVKRRGRSNLGPDPSPR